MGKVHRHIPSRGAGPLAKAPQDRATAQAYQLRSAKKYVEAKPLFKKLYEAAPQDFALALDYGEICMETEDFTAAVHVYAKILEAEPKHLMALTNLGGALIRAGKLDDARAMLEYALELDPKNIHARINLGGILQAAGDRKGNLDNALEAVSIEPSSALAFNNLGSAFSDMAMFAEAKHAYETAVMLDPKQVDALVNLAAVEARLGNPASSAEKYEQVLKLLPASAKHRADAVKFYASFEYLKQGILEKGWDYYEGGFSPLVPVNGARSPNRKFSVPRWDGELLNGKTLLVWREQGLGDELLFATCLHELAALGGQIIVECDARLVETFTRSFPDYRVRAEAFLPQAGNISPNNDFDLHVPMGSLMKYFRRDINDFKRSGAYIKPDTAKVAKFAERLSPYKAEHRLVGICWRSGKLDPVRNLGYTTLEDWAELFRTPGFKFVNLQYGECEAELRAAEEKYGVEILRWPDLNLKDQLEEVFALIASLDCVVSVQTAALVMAGAAGIPSFGLRAGGWTALGNQQSSPWFKTQRNTGLAGLPVELEWRCFELLMDGLLPKGLWGDIGMSRDFSDVRYIECSAQYAGALTATEHASLIRAEPSQRSKFTFYTSKNFYDIGILLGHIGLFAIAKEYMDRAYSLGNEHFNGYVRIAQCAAEKGEWSLAQNLALEDLSRGTAQPPWLVAIALIVGRNGNKDSASELITEAYRRDEKINNGHLQLAFCRAEESGDWADALALSDIDKSLGRLDDYGRLLIAAAHCMLGKFSQSREVLEGILVDDTPITPKPSSTRNYFLGDRSSCMRRLLSSLGPAPWHWAFGGTQSKQPTPAELLRVDEMVLSALPASAKHRTDAVKFYASFEYLKQGILEKGWDYYEGGFSPLVPVNGARSPNRKFSVPRWDGELLNGKTLLVWREQGLGDELLFATCLHELAALGGQIIVECDARLVETFTRSFPDYRVRAEAFLPQAGNISPNNDFDLHVPMGSLMKYFRRDINDFKRSGAYIKPDTAKVAKFAERLSPYKAEHRLVGICWRSGKLDPVRNLGYTTLEDWAELFRTPGFKFVNLQYGECEAELRAAEEKYGVEILRWPDLNLKDQLEEVFALIASLDCVVSVQTAALVMAGAAGIPSFGLRAGGWTALGNQQSSPWFKTQRNTGLAGLPVELDSHFHEVNFIRRIGKTQHESPNLIAVKIRDIKLLLLKENKTDLWWYAQKSVFEEQASTLYKLISGDGFSHFIDVGANYGYVSLLVGKNSPRTNIQCIEPDVRLSRLIEENFIINGVPVPKIINAIAGDQSQLHSTFALNPHSSLDNRVTQGGWNQVPVATIRLDDRLFEIPPAERVFIKVDTQGYEPRVILGMNEWLKTRHNWIVKFEFSPFLIRSQGGDPLDFLANMAGNFQCAEFPSRVPFKQMTLTQLFSSLLEARDVGDFVDYVESLGENLTGQVDLVIRSKFDSQG